MPSSPHAEAPAEGEAGAPPARLQARSSPGGWLHRPILLLPCLLLLCVTLPHLEQGDFRRDTGRYGAVGLYMWSGGDLLAPHLAPGVPYFNKPPLAFWAHGLSLKLFGRNLPAARWPSILAALGVLCLSVLSARTLGSNSEALVSGIVLALTYEFFRRTREISLDFWQLLFVMLGVWFFAGGLRKNAGARVVASGLGIGLALLCKPFVALGLFPIFGLWALLAGRKRLLAPLFLGALPVALLVAAPWHYFMYLKFGDAFIRQYIFHEVIGRARGETGHAPIYYYVVQQLTTCWPWLAFAGYAVYHRLRQSEPRGPNRDLVLLGGTWVLCVLVLISLFADKSPNYSLPLYPMLSWVAAAGLCRIPWRALREWRASDFRWLAPAALALFVVLAVAPIRFQDGPNRDWQRLFLWLKLHGIAPGDVAGAGLKPNDRCYFYIKTGQWPAEFPGTGGGDWVLALRPAGQPAFSVTPVFAAGPLAVFSRTNTPAL